MKEISWSVNEKNKIKTMSVSYRLTGYMEIEYTDEQDKLEGVVEFPIEELDMLIKTLHFLRDEYKHDKE